MRITTFLLFINFLQKFELGLSLYEDMVYLCTSSYWLLKVDILQAIRNVNFVHLNYLLTIKKSSKVSCNFVHSDKLIYLVG